jgi:uncharacterized protein YlzI (FlbEa/FlbD family)
MKYIGESTEWHNLSPDVTIELKNGEDYDVQLQQEGPQMIVNGQMVIHPDTTIWAVFNGREQIRIPYAANLVNNFWR